MTKRQGAALDRKKLFADPIMVTTVVVLIAFLTLFIIYPLAILLVDSFISPDGGGFTLSVFKRIFDMWTFRTAIGNTLKVGFMVGIGSALIGLLFAYVEVYVKVRGKFMGGLFKVVSMLPVVSPPFVLSLSIIMLFGKSGIITRYLLHIYDNSVYGFWGIVIVQTMTFFPVCYLMLRGLLKNIDPSLEEAARDMGASRWKVFTSVTLPLMLPGLGNAFLVSFIESIADFANPMIIGGSYDTLATTIYLQITGAYDKIGAAAMAVVLLSITFIMFLVQKYYLERKTAATLTGKASRARMLITDKSVRVPLTVLCSAIAIFVILMYICVPFGALFNTWGYDFHLTFKWFERVFTRYHGLQAFTDSFVLSLIAAPITSLLSMIISYLVVKKNFKTKGFIEFASMLAMAVPGTVLGVGYIRGFANGIFHTGLMQGLYGTGAFWSSCSLCAACPPVPAAVFPPYGRSIRASRNPPMIWVRAAARCSPPSLSPSSRIPSSAVWSPRSCAALPPFPPSFCWSRRSSCSSPCRSTSSPKRAAMAWPVPLPPSLSSSPMAPSCS